MDQKGSLSPALPQNDSLSILHHYNLSTQPKYETVEMLLSTQNMQF